MICGKNKTVICHQVRDLKLSVLELENEFEEFVTVSVTHSASHSLIHPHSQTQSQFHFQFQSSSRSVTPGPVVTMLVLLVLLVNPSYHLRISSEFHCNSDCSQSVESRGINRGGKANQLSQLRYYRLWINRNNCRAGRM